MNIGLTALLKEQFTYCSSKRTVSYLMVTLISYVHLVVLWP